MYPPWRQPRGKSTSASHPGLELGANLKSISHRCYLWEVAFEWELIKETIYLPLSCLQRGVVNMTYMFVTNGIFVNRTYRYGVIKTF